MLFANARIPGNTPGTSSPHGYALWWAGVSWRWRRPPTAAPTKNMYRPRRDAGVFKILVALRQWSEEFDDRPEEIATILVDRERGRPVKKLELHSQDGQILAQADIALKPRPQRKSPKHTAA